MYVMDSIIGWLRSVKEDKGADWLVDYWSGERGLWNIGAAGVSCPNTNCGVESGWGRIRKSVCAGLKNSTFAHFMTIFLNYETRNKSVPRGNKSVHLGTKVHFLGTKVFNVLSSAR